MPDDKYFGADPTVFKAITKQNEFTDALTIREKGWVFIEDTGSMSMTVSLQVKPNKSADWMDTGDEFTSEGAWPIPYGGGHQYRLGVKTGNFTSGTARLTLSGRNKI